MTGIQPIALESFARVPFFKEIDTAVLQELSKGAQIGEFAPGHCLIKAGEKPLLAAFVIEGHLQAKECALDGRLTGVQILGPGALVGWLPLMDGLPSRQTIEVLKKTVLLLIPIQQFRSLCCAVPEMASRLLQAAGIYLRNQQHVQDTVHIPNAYHRVFVCIHKFVSQHQGSDAPSLPKQQEIAATANTSRETVSRALQALIKAGVIAKNGHQLIVQKEQVLEKVAEKGPEALHQ